MSEQTEKYFRRFTQEEAQYTTLSTTKGKACANCRWFSLYNEHGEPTSGYCHIVEMYPLDIMPTGYSNQWEAIPTPEETNVVIEADNLTVIVESEPEMGSMETKAGAVLNKVNRDMLKTAFQTIKGVLEKAGVSWEDDEEKSIKKTGGAFSVFKSNKTWLWKAIWSNNFEDRDNEIITEKAFDGYIARLDSGLVPMPELWYWHTKGTKHGQATWVGRIGHMMTAVGTFDDTPMAKQFIEYYKHNKDGVSHGFTFPKWAKKDGVYEVVNTFEISPLIPQVAANPYTLQEILDMSDMTPEKRKHLESIIGKQATDELVTKTEAISKALEGAGIAYKDFGDVEGAKDAATATKETPVDIAGLFVELVAAQGALKERQDKLETEMTAVKSENVALKTINEQLREKMKMTPRASIAQETVTSDVDKAKDIRSKGSDFDPVWAQFGLEVIKENKNE